MEFVDKYVKIDGSNDDVMSAVDDEVNIQMLNLLMKKQMFRIKIYQTIV